jgi:agmatinase
VFDWSVVRSTGTPEPGGMLWDEGLELLRAIFLRKTVVAIDVVELIGKESDPNSAFAVAKLIHKMLAFKLMSKTRTGRLTRPAAPRGPLFQESGPR